MPLMPPDSRSAPHSPRAKILWLLAAACLLLGALGLTLLSKQFIWGEGHAQRPIEWAIALQGLMGIGFLLAVFQILRPISSRAKSTKIHPSSFNLHPLFPLPLLAVAIAARLILIPSNLIQESDCYRYVLDGSSILHGVNPFRHAPEDLPDAAEGQFRQSLETPEARHILSRVSYPDLPTIYPPLSQLAFTAGAALTPWDWRGQRLIFLLFDVAIIFLLLGGLRRLGKPPAWALLYAWNPLVLKEIANSAHLDSLVALAILALCLALAAGAKKPTPAIAALSAALFAAAILAKVYPLILAPLCLAVLARGAVGRAQRLALFSLLTLLLTALAIAPFLSVGWPRLTESLTTYAADWERNAGAHALLSTLLAYLPAKFPLTPLLQHPSFFALLIPLVVALHASWKILKANEEEAPELTIAGFQNTLLAWFLFLPAAFPWYALPLLALAPLRPRPWAIVLTLTFSLYYLVFLYDYRDYAESWNIATRVIEHAPVWIALALGCLLKSHFITSWHGLPAHVSKGRGSQE